MGKSCLGKVVSAKALLHSVAGSLEEASTRDRLPFLPSDPLCVFCQQEEESHDHLFFACEWTSCLWGKIKS
jgi:hypothetical protein